MGAEIEKTIDIDKILRDKMGAKAKFVPSFAVNWLKRILHEDEVNQFLWDSRGLSGTEWLTECVRYLDMTLQIEGLENLPDKDDGKLYTFESDNHILMFPAGLNSRKINGKIHDLEWKKTFIAKSVEYQRDVVPIFFGGRNSDRFYRIARFSDKYVKKVNIAMLFLVDEMYRNVGKTFLRFRERKR